MIVEAIVWENQCPPHDIIPSIIKLILQKHFGIEKENIGYIFSQLESMLLLRECKFVEQDDDASIVISGS